MTISERIIQLIDEKELTLSQFANVLNVTPSYISKLKKNPDAVPSDRTISDICRIFHVNELWLRTGEGEMFQEKTREVEIAEIAGEMIKSKETDFKFQLMKLIGQLDSDQIQVLRNMTVELYENLKEAEEKAAKENED